MFLPANALIRAKLLNPFNKGILLILVLLFFILLVLVGGFFWNQLNKEKMSLLSQNSSLNDKLNSVQKMYDDLSNQDQVKINQSQRKEIQNIHDNYQQAIKEYQQIIDLRDEKEDTSKLDSEFAQVLNLLADNNYSSASASLAKLKTDVDSLNQKLAAAQATSEAPAQSQTPVASSNTPPSSGLSHQSVQTDVGTFTLDIIAADLNSTKVIVDTASSSDCGNDCPVLPLADYVSRNGAYAGINGAFFCPATYPSCAGRTNSFDTLLMNKNKVYFNSANNVYSTVPAAIFSPGSARFVSQSLQWGRDTSPDSVIANYPLLVSGNQVVFSSSDDPKFNGKGARCFIANRGNMVYIGTIYNATMSDSAQVLKTLGMDNALNLDEGGSTALWYGGSYKAGPGRNLPDAVLFVKR